MPKSDSKKQAPMPMSGAGLMRFFEDDTHGIKIRPHYIVISSIVLMSTVIIAHIITGY
jgi:preprotein translocase subunit Sec61beta